MGLRLTEQQQRLAMFDGFACAAKRHEDAQTQGLRASYVALAESLFWAGVIDEHLRRSLWYQELLEMHPDGEVLPGMRYARNFATHQLVAVSEADLAEIGEVTPTIRISLKGMRWAPFEDLPEPGGRPHQHLPGQQAAYREHLANQSTTLTFLRLKSWFAAASEAALASVD